MLTCYILDDERAAVEVLKRYVSDTPELILGGFSTHVLEAAQSLKERPVDLLFLDIEMPKLSGPQFMELYAQQTGVIFTTAYSDYALEGYERGVIDYLMKPITYSRFLKAVEKAQKQLSVIQVEPIPVSTPSNDDFIFVKTEHKGKFRKINLNDIVYVEGLKNYVSINTKQREQIVIYIGITELEAKLPSNRFVRVHRSYIIALDAVLSIDGNEIYLKDAPRIPTAGSYKDDLFRRLEHHFVQSKR
ncbi:LytR/AlgR family response regulator transcription factor [Spirosoma soli]|uniref:LytR/AlgR family response regulator transcription factor n=1 Tax=Spirosoma soli TaxID=1770529 RepID=A0ABW5M2Z1_9BACT